MSWYKIAKQEKKPYDIVLLSPAGDKKIGEVDAHSEMQAIRFFLQQDNQDYASYLEMGYTIKANFNEDEFNRRQRLKKYEEELREDQIQNAWWQN